MNVNYIKQIQRIRKTITERLERMRELYQEVQDFTHADAWDAKQAAQLYNELAVIKKRADDAMVSLNKIYRFLVYDNFDSSRYTFFRNSLFIDTTLPQVVTAYTCMDFEVRFQNKGVFYSWTQDKGIKAKIQIKRQNGFLYDNEYSFLDESLEGNTPGDESINEDYDRIKIFYFSIMGDFPPDEYYFEFSITDQENGDYNMKFTKQVTVEE